MTTTCPPRDTRTVPGRDTKTRFAGVYARHRETCATTADRSKTCTCKPSYYGKVYDRSRGRAVKTRMVRDMAVARSLRRDLEDALERGTFSHSRVRVREAAERFVIAARDGIALNKRGRRYKPSAIKDIEDALRVHVLPHIGPKKLTEVRRSDCQEIVDRMVAAGKSGSRVRSVVNAIHSLYRFAEDRELASGDPARLVRLPAVDSKPRDRVATPQEFARLLDALPLTDALPYAIAGYAGLRRGEIQRLRWSDVDQLVHVREGKSDAAARTVPVIAPLRSFLRQAQMAQGRPDPDTRVCPPSRYVRTGEGFSSGALATRSAKRWREAKLAPIGLHECRHTFATWTEAAGIRDRVRSQLLGHALPTEGAQVTRRYTHVLPGDLDEARELLEAYVEREVRLAQGGNR